MDGIIIINKPKGFTSNDVVSKIKHIFNCKVGHTGTLDPNATGVLPLLLGNGTKFSKYLINHDKKYCATLKLGIKMSTADVEGEVVAEMSVDDNIFNKELLEHTLDRFKGKQIQTPPIYSAIKVKGKKLYEYARKGIEVDVPKREVEIYNIELIDFDVNRKTVKFNVECSKGTYIRSLCEDIAEKFNTVGYMLDLERLRAGTFNIEDSITLEEIIENKENIEWLGKHIITLESLLANKPKINIEKNRIDKFYNGVKLSVNKEDGLYRIYCDDTFIGSGIVENSKVRRDVILNNL